MTPQQFSYAQDNVQYTQDIVKSYRHLVENEFGRESIMVRIAKCESDFNQYSIVDNTIKVLRGIYNSDDVGIFQINVEAHEKDIKNGGYDIYTPEGNIEFARSLYDRQGTSPWNYSKKCWGR